MSQFVNRIRTTACAVAALTASTAFADGSGTNLILNNSFESGNLSGGWSAGGPGVTFGGDTAFTGYSGSFLYQAQTGPNGFLHASLAPIAAGTTLCLEFDFASTNAFGTLMIGQSVPFIGFLNDIGSVQMQGGTQTGMTRYAFVFTANDGIEAVGFEWNALPGGTFAIDNVSLSVVPAPGAVALLGLAGLVGRRRR